MVSRLTPFIPETWATMLAEARRTGQDQHWPMYDGYRLSVRVKERWIILRISHTDTVIPAHDLQTFHTTLGIPETAVRTPRQGQGQYAQDALTKWYFVGYQWEQEDGDAG
jgi:hypothetical protein